MTPCEPSTKAAHCRICGDYFLPDAVRTLNLYVFGSEGVTACHACEMAIVEHIRQMGNLANRSRLAVYRLKNKENNHEHGQ